MSLGRNFYVFKRSCLWGKRKNAWEVIKKMSNWPKSKPSAINLYEILFFINGIPCWERSSSSSTSDIFERIRFFFFFTKQHVHQSWSVNRKALYNCNFLLVSEFCTTIRTIIECLQLIIKCTCACSVCVLGHFSLLVRVFLLILHLELPRFEFATNILNFLLNE